MKLTQIVYRQHIDRMFKKHWRIQGQRVPINMGADVELKAKGIPIHDPLDVIKEPRKHINLDIVGVLPKPVAFDRTHPNWHDEQCFFHRDHNVLLEGIDQAKILTKTVEVQEGLPESIHKTKISKEINNKVLKIILSSHIFDTQQEKLPKIKDPLRPAFNFPRVLGITNERINHILISKLLHLCESISDRALNKERTVLNDAKFRYLFRKDEDLIQFELRADKLLLSAKPLSPITQSGAEEIDLPNLYPIKHTITLTPEHIYVPGDVYPLKQSVLNHHPHTIFIHYNPQEVQNLYEEEVTQSQILGRSLMKSFTVAAAHARQKFGNDIKVLPKPVTLQCVQTDGKQFHFSIFQLNTLEMGEGGPKNVWYSADALPLFVSCGYKLGKPTVDGYNPEIISNLLSFYHNV